MKSIKATCPVCDHQILLDEVLSKEFNSMIDKETKSILEEKDNEIRNILKKLSNIEEKNKLEMQNFADKEVRVALRKQAFRLEEQQKLLLNSKNEELEGIEKKLHESQKNELSLRRKISKVEQREQEIDLEIERKLSEQAASLKEKVTKKIADEYHRKDSEREQLITELRKQLIEMKQKAELGSEQTRGEMFEDEIGTLLREAFPRDNMEDVPKGVCGADLIQSVSTSSGQKAGKILWELKQTKSFQPQWVEKLKSDRNEMGAELAILVTATMPKGKSGAYLDQGVWIVEPAVAISVAKVARQSLIDVHRAAVVSNVRLEKADILYNYLTNPVFRQRLEAIVESFHQMREDLDREKRAIAKTWKRRDRQLEAVVENTVHIYSDIQSVVGQKVLNIQRLELPGENLEVVQNE